MTEITPELIDEFVPALKGYADCAGTEGFAINAACLMLETIADKLRTGQLILAQPSGDEVEAVARAIAKTDGLDWDEKCGHETDQEECDSGTCVAAFVEDHDPDWARSIYRAHATAAITALDAVRGKQ